MNRMFTHHLTVLLASKEKLVMINEIKENELVESTKLRDESNEIKQKIHTLQAELDASLALAREACAERDELRTMLDNRQAEIAESRVEDQETMEEMKKLLAEIAAQESGGASEASQKSGMELTKQVVELIERNLERLAQRAEVSGTNPKTLLPHAES